MVGRLHTLGTQSTKAPDLFDRLGTALQQSKSESKFKITKLAPDLEKIFIKDFTNSPWYRDFIKRSGGEKPDIGPNSDYEYRCAWLDDLINPVSQDKPNRTLDLTATGPNAHGYSKDSRGKWLKNPQTHNTSWKQWYSEITGSDPDEYNVSREDAAAIIKGHIEMRKPQDDTWGPSKPAPTKYY